MRNYSHLENVLQSVGVGPEWYKRGSLADGKNAIFLDCSVKRGLALIDKILNSVPEINILITTYLPDEDYLEIAVTPERNTND